MLSITAVRVLDEQHNNIICIFASQTYWMVITVVRYSLPLSSTTTPGFLWLQCPPPCSVHSTPCPLLSRPVITIRHRTSWFQHLLSSSFSLTCPSSCGPTHHNISHHPYPPGIPPPFADVHTRWLQGAAVSGNPLCLNFRQHIPTGSVGPAVIRTVRRRNAVSNLYVCISFSSCLFLH